MAKNENDSNQIKIKKLEEEIHQFHSLLQNQKKIENESRIEVLKEIHSVKEGVDEKITKKMNHQIAIIGAILSVLATLGYFGLRSSLPKIIDEKIGVEVKTELKSIMDTAKNSLELIKSIENDVKKPLIVVQTDYGNNAAYMGSLLGVIYKTNQNARVQISTSGIENFNIIHAAWTLWRSSRLYPVGTIFLAITNPGGTESNVRKVVMITKNDLIFIGHDNGIFDMVVKNLGHKKTYVISSPEFTPVEVKDLFGGVDIFAPTAARISQGCQMDKIGPVDYTYKMKLPGVVHEIQSSFVKGTVMDVDNFANVTLNLSDEDLEKINKRVTNHLKIKFRGKTISMPLMKTYGDVPKGSLVAIIYDGYLQLAINIGRFNDIYKFQRGDIINIE